MTDPSTNLPDGVSETALNEAARLISRSPRIAVLTGAGVSAESGIPTFRDALTGQWASFDPQRLATPEGFAADPAGVTAWYDHRRLECLTVQPNPGHLALASLHRRLAVLDEPGWCRIITQNVDGLHARAGSPDVIELHGSIARWRCTRTARETEPPPEPMPDYPPPSPFAEDGVLRPCVVWFGEFLPRSALDQAQQAIEACGLLLVVGASAVVYPAAGLIDIALMRGQPVIEINPRPTDYTARVACAIPGPAGVVLPELLARADLPADPSG